MVYPLLGTALLISVSPRSALAEPMPPLQTANALGQELYLRSGSTGLVMVVVRGGETAIETFGETAPGSRQAPGADSLLRLCSLTKIFATDLLVKLMDDKRVRLDTALQELAPKPVRVPMRGGRTITLET